MQADNIRACITRLEGDFDERIALLTQDEVTRRAYVKGKKMEKHRQKHVGVV